MRGSRGNALHRTERRDQRGDENISGGSETELSVIIRAPRPYRAGGVERHAVPIAGGDRYRVSYDSNGSRVELETDDPTELLHRLTSDALGRGERLHGLTVARPTLEEVYLELTEESATE